MVMKTEDNQKQVKNMKDDIETTTIDYPTDEDYDFLREVFGLEEAVWDVDEARALAVRFGNLQKLQKTLERNGPAIETALIEGDLTKLRTALIPLIIKTTT
ncbi:unnamed protein product [marine sediment metagenome]|uniref:Uncharacterized protein n=2 Tax=marine sediment metagenome TaxID=412755 RepID=X1MGI7_9ZZZZ